MTKSITTADPLRGCTALITGASSGIGRELARQLAPRADHLILVARRLDRLEALKSELTRDHAELSVDCRQADLSDAAEVEGLLQWLDGSGRSISLLINNAGLGDHGEFAGSDWNRIERILKVNIVALTRITQHLLPRMRRQRRGAILNVSSVAGLMPVPTLAVYAASKAYVCSFSEALRAELRSTGIMVTTLCPGPVDTEFHVVAEPEGSSAPPGSPEFLKVPVEEVARAALAAVARDRARVIPGLAMATVGILATLTPLFIMRFFLNRYRVANR